jgi:hypothetical protein
MEYHISNNKKMNLIVYHIFCVNNYLEIVNQQLNRLKTSGLYDWCDKFEVTCIDQENKFEGIDELFSEFNKANVFKTKENRYEYWGIKKMWDISQENEGKVFYFHTKGVANKYKNFETKELSDWKIKGVQHWKECMEYFLIDNFQKCIEKLDEFDHCGVTCNNGWYSGNFWWSNLSFIKENPEPGHGDRWYFENWLNHARTFKSFEFFHFDYNGFFSYFPETIYKENKTLWDVDCILESAFYGAIDIQQDEGYLPPEGEKLEDITNEVINLIKTNEVISCVDNRYFGDPAYMKKKYLIVNFLVNGQKCMAVYNEGWKFDLSFLKLKSKKPKILFLGHTSKVYDGHLIKIDRSDLTRRMSCLETWVPEIEQNGHEVIFFEGNSEKIKYDEVNRLLSLPIQGDYDYNPPRVDPPRSLMLDRLIAAIDWSLKNKEFDFIFRTDDGSYINSFVLDKIYEEIEDFDCITNGFLGGAGMFFSKDLCKKLVESNMVDNFSLKSSIEDHAICKMVQSFEPKIKHLNLLCSQYVLGENLFTIHYTNGKRMYFVDYTIKRYYNEECKSSRKIILNYYIDSYYNDYPNTWTFENGVTPRWYSYTTNHKNWEHYGQLIRSNYNIVCENHFGKNSIDKLIIYKTPFNLEHEHERMALLSYYDVLNQNGTLFFFYEEENDHVKEIVKFLESNNLKIDKGISNIKYIINTDEIKSEDGYLLQIKKI